MPASIADRLPLPSLKVYAASSVLQLSAAVYYAMSGTSDPTWKANSTTPNTVRHQDQDLGARLSDLLAFMLQEPLCLWSLINVAYCSLVVLGVIIQRAVFGKLREPEIQRIYDKFWNYIFYKFIFVFGVINVQYMDEVLLWCSWFSVLGFLHLLAILCKDRFDYLSSTPSRLGWEHARLGALLFVILGSSVAMLAAAAAVGLPSGLDTFCFMAAECVVLVLSSLQVFVRFFLYAHETHSDRRAPLQYYTTLVFDTLILCVEVVSHGHMLLWTSMLVSMPSLVLVMQLRHLYGELRARLRRHRVYRWVLRHMDQNYPMATKEEVEAHTDNCAICWERMETARKLPCNHLFHNSCLSSWLQQDASCPTCRRQLPSPAPASHLRAAAAPVETATVVRPENHLFHFDGSRYVSWWPSVSVEVSRVRMAARVSQHEALALRVQSLFPHYPLHVILADLARTNSLRLTVDNILDGRVPLPPGYVAVAQLDDATTGNIASTGNETRNEEPTISTEVVERDIDLQETEEQWSDSDEANTTRFSKSATEREAMLNRRKEQLVLNARKKYINRHDTSLLDQPAGAGHGS